MFQRKKGIIAAAGVALLSVGSAHAALPTEATDALTAVSTDATSLATAAWPVLVGIVSTFVIMKLFKRFISKAA